MYDPAVELTGSGSIRYGFEVRVRLRASADPGAFIDRLIDAVEVGGLSLGGGGRVDHFAGFVARMDDLSATEADRTWLGAFLVADADVEHHEVGGLVDADAEPDAADHKTRSGAA
ncbi:DUF469 family protein [Patescibacteria group bacterium]|nr:MAG: DUF469 family protein [Patescibacteria group bacterium]